MNHLEATLGTIMSKHMDKTTALRSLNADDVEVVVAMVQECSQATHTATIDECVRIAGNINLSTEIEFIKPEDQKGYYRAQTDIITAITTNQKET
jgi:hypothetical protein